MRIIHACVCGRARALSIADRGEKKSKIRRLRRSGNASAVVMNVARYHRDWVVRAVPDGTMRFFDARGEAYGAAGVGVGGGGGESVEWRSANSGGPSVRLLFSLAVSRYRSRCVSLSHSVRTSRQTSIPTTGVWLAHPSLLPPPGRRTHARRRRRRRRDAPRLYPPPRPPATPFAGGLPLRAPDANLRYRRNVSGRTADEREDTVRVRRVPLGARSPTHRRRRRRRTRLDRARPETDGRSVGRRVSQRVQ